MLAPGRYPVDSTLTVSASNLIVTGGGGPGDTILYRGNSSLDIIVGEGNGATGVTISNLTVDGNRYGFGTAPPSGVSSPPNLSCLLGNGPYWDVDLTGGGQFTVYWLDFINAPATALLLGGGGSSVSLSNFGQGGYGVGAGGGTAPSSETAMQSATRSTAIYINDGNNGAWYNYISYAGTAGITLNGSSQYAYGNQLYQNRYEPSDWAPVRTLGCLGGGCLQQGGQLAVNGAPNQTITGGCPGYTCSTNAYVAGNVINGNSWPTLLPNGSYPAQATGCQWGTGLAFNAGVEGYGFGHALYNTRVMHSYG
jgi:hypothetical protein